MLDLRCVNVIHSNFLHKESLAELLQQHVSLVPNLFLVFLSAPLLLPLVPTWLCLLPGYEFATANWMDDKSLILHGFNGDQCLFLGQGFSKISSTAAHLARCSI